MATLGEAKVNIRANLAPLKAGLRKANKLVVKSMGKLAGGSIKMVGNVIKKAVSSILRSIKRLAQVATAALIGALAASVKASISFQKQMAFVNTMLTESTEHLMPEFGDAILQMSKDFGKATDTLSKGLFNILSASIKAENAIGVLAVVSKTAAAGLADVSTTAFAITGILNAYGKEATAAANISDILFAAVKRGQTTFDQLAPSIGRVTAIAASAGIPFEEVAAALATITRGGIRTDEAVTSLRMAIIALQGNTEGAIKIAKHHGITLSVAALKEKKLAGAIRELNQLNPQIIKDMFTEIRARVGLNVLLKDQAGFMSDLDLAMNSAGLTQEAFEKQSATLSFQLGRTKETIKATAKSIGDVFAPAVERINEDIRNWLDDNETEFPKWAEVLRVEFKKVEDYFNSLLDLIEDSGWKAAWDKLFEDAKKVLKDLLEWVKPKAIEIGIAMAEGIRKGLVVGMGMAIKSIPKNLLTVAGLAAKTSFILGEAQQQVSRFNKLEQRFADQIPVGEIVGGR